MMHGLSGLDMGFIKQNGGDGWCEHEVCMPQQWVQSRVLVGQEN